MNARALSRGGGHGGWFRDSDLLLYATPAAGHRLGEPARLKLVAVRCAGGLLDRWADR